MSPAPLDPPVALTPDGAHAASRQPLEGVIVLDLGQIYNAPYATFLMAMAGADVIKVEPRTGENLRGRTQASGAGAPFAMLNSNKRAITLDLRSDRGREIVLELADRADVFVENFRPGVTDRLGIGAEVVQARNPRLIYASGSGFGKTGPYRDFAAMDLTVQAIAGIMSVTGYPDRPPVKAGPALCDFFGGVHLYGAITTALYERERTGVGRAIEVSMFESVYPSLMSSLGLYFGSGGEAPTRTGNRHAGLAEAPYNVYPTSDGYVAIIGVSDQHWRSLAEVMGREDLADAPGWGTRRERVARMDDVDDVVSDFTARYARDELLELLRGARVPCAPVRDIGEVVTDEHLHERGMLQEFDHPDLGPITLPHSPLRYEGVEPIPLKPSPRLGEHNAEILRDMLGFGDEQIDELIAQDVL